MSNEEIEAAQEQIKELKAQLIELQKESKEIERSLSQDQKVLAQEKDQLMSGIQARMQLIDILKRDIIRMAYVESVRIAETEYNKLPPLSK
ncbi:hypothetical protein TRFO_00831 [Tritrichomonas foetus]|uniref:Uncharacterized protein n=1 Tax=Tritrichomonas foetus TaxID=1144522 RepID=A0A1J4L6K8_9EUKA|nr:hypothetical protein TRFO_00831 [Tritrichomonas foetus]|eukprot:OHT17582.1 hypothetical protein TRFO_00831 [Tritrichomonas foetus]